MNTKQEDISYIKENIWRELKDMFQKYQKLLMQQNNQQLVKSLVIKNQNQKQQQIQQTNKNRAFTINYVFRQFQHELRNKISAIIFKISVFQVEKIQKDLKTAKEQYQYNQSLQSKEKQIERLMKKQTDLQILVKTYEKKLISKSKNQNFNFNQQEKYKREQLIQKRDRKENICPQIIQNRIKRLQIMHVSNIMIQNQNNSQKLKQKSNLSSSRLATSRFSKNYNQPSLKGSALKQLQQNWNKSSNLSSKNIKSSRKYEFYYQDSNDKNLNKSSIRQNLSCKNKSILTKQKENLNNQHSSKKINETKSKLSQSFISQFILNSQ